MQVANFDLWGEEKFENFVSGGIVASPRGFGKIGLGVFPKPTALLGFYRNMQTLEVPKALLYKGFDPTTAGDKKIFLQIEKKLLQLKIERV